MKIFVSGPYSKGDVREAIIVGNNLRAMGHTPFVPHLTAFWHMLIPHEVEYWYGYDLEWLEVCDAVYRLPGESVGASKEVVRAVELGKPVFYSYANVLAYDRFKKG